MAEKKNDATRPLTRRQAEVWVFIHDHRESKGFAPSLREVCAEFGWVSTKAANDVVDALERKGYLRRTPKIARGLVTIGDQASVRLVATSAAGASA